MGVASVDPLVELVAERLHNMEYPAYSETAHPDSNRWSWRADGHLGLNGETDHYDRYREMAVVAVAAVREQASIAGSL